MPDRGTHLWVAASSLFNGFPLACPLGYSREWQKFICFIAGVIEMK
jgi:hypothetical protein